MSAAPTATPRLPLLAGFLAAYVALDWISYIQPVGSFPITPWNPPPGLSLAFLLRYGPRQGAWLLVAALLAEVLVRGLDTPAYVIFGASALPALVYTVSAALILRRGGLADGLASLRDMARFLAIVFAATGVVAIGIVAIYRSAGLLDGAIGEALAKSWIGDFVGIAVTTPAILLLAARPSWRPAATWTVAAQAVAIAAAFVLVFGLGLREERLFYVLFLPLVWIAMQHGLPGATLAMAAIQVGLVVVIGQRHEALLDFQFLMLALCLTGLLLGAAVSERRRIERELRDKQFELDRSLRMAAASELASALAHELQQPLTALGNYVRAGALMAGRRDLPPAELEAVLQKAVGEIERASLVVRRLRDFFRTGAAALEPVAPQRLAAAAEATVRARLERHAIGLQVSCTSDLPCVQVDRIQIEGVLHNLLANAIDALKLAPEARRIDVRIERASEGVLFSVEDNGPGLPAETAGRLFEHFATSKPHGMGLGLAISRSIVEAHGGRIWHESLPRGTAFRFLLPASE